MCSIPYKFLPQWGIFNQMSSQFSSEHQSYDPSQISMQFLCQVTGISQVVVELIAANKRVPLSQIPCSSVKSTLCKFSALFYKQTNAVNRQ